jgi:hypothetical protein
MKVDVDTTPGFLLWRYHGDLMAATTALGLHRGSESRSAKASIRSEIRRRIYATVFNIDKTLASFTSRPPFLSHRYASCPMPLDIERRNIFHASRKAIENHCETETKWLER